MTEMLLALRDSYLGSLLLRNENNQYILNKREHFFLHLKLNFIWSSLQKQEAKSTLNLKTQKEGHITTAFTFTLDYGSQKPQKH